MPGVRKLIKIDLAEVERLAGLGLSEKQIIESLGIGYRTFYRRKAESVEFQDALARGKARTVAQVANKLYELCMAKNITAIVWYEKTRCGYSEHVTLSGDAENPLMVATRDSIAGFAPGSVRDSTGSEADSNTRSRETVGQNGARGGARRNGSSR